MSVSGNGSNTAQNPRRGLYTSFHQKQIGKTIRPRAAQSEKITVEGVVTGLSQRYCAACQRNAVCYIVKWNDGKKTFPCAKGVEVNGDELLLM